MEYEQNPEKLMLKKIEEDREESKREELTEMAK